MQDIINKIDSVLNLDELEQIRLELFGKKGSITAEFNRLKDVEPENKKAYAQSLNIKRDTLTAKLNEKKLSLESEYIKSKMKSEAIDISLFNEPLSTGALHPVMETMDRIIEYFVAQNFSIETGPLIEDDFHNFEHRLTAIQGFLLQPPASPPPLALQEICREIRQTPRRYL